MFEVWWSPRAQGQLAAIWAESSDRNAITAAVDLIDRSLRNDPNEQGESREVNERVVIVSPLVIDFRVSEDDRRVEVLTVRHPRRRPQE